MPTTSATPVRRLIDAARVVVGRVGVDGFTLDGVAQAAGVPLGLLRYHFRSREHLLIEAWRQTFRRIHEAFEARFDEGQGGLPVALEALDALWSALRDMRAFAPFLVQTLATATHDRELGARLADFNREAEARVELGFIRLFPEQLDQLALPPDRLARAVRTGLVGLLVELAAAHDEDGLAAVERTYADVRELLARVVVGPPAEHRR
jgi:AcrR family transcriptional regulator